MKKEDKNWLNEKFGEYLKAADEMEHQALLKELLDRLEQLNEHDSESWHLWGILLYNNDDDPQVALAKFEKALSLNPSHMAARLYAGHSCHDMKDWEGALSHYLKVDGEKLKKFELWRHTKWLEQIGFCYYQAGNMELAESYFRKVLAVYQTIPFDDLMRPADMLNCLAENHELIISLKEAVPRLK